MNALKQFPVFKNKDEEREFRNTDDLSDYFDISKSVVNPTLTSLKPSTKTITIRITESLLNILKRLANKKDVPYQS